MAIACFLLLTFFPLRPLRSVPSLRLCIADLTSLDALFDVLRGANAVLLLNFTQKNYDEKNNEYEQHRSKALRE